MKWVFAWAWQAVWRAAAGWGVGLHRRARGRWQEESGRSRRLSTGGATRNALRHAEAGRIEIELETADGGQAVELRISDDGRGLSATSARGEGMGLRIMANRATVVGGSLELLPRPGGGTRVSCRVPARKGEGPVSR